MSQRPYQVCRNCVMDTTDSKITFDATGLCDHCQNFYAVIEPQWQRQIADTPKLNQLVETIKQEGKGKEYDCIIGLSGGMDSSYLLYYAKDVLGLRPLAYSVDTGWTLNVALENIEKIVRGLDLELHTDIINWNEMKDLQLAFFKSQVAYQDLPQDHVIFAGLYNYAIKHKIKYVLTGGNIATEAIREPIEWVYQNDLTHIRDIHKIFGEKPIRDLPMTGMFKYKLYYRFVKGMKVLRPLDMIPYTKELATKTLKERFDWEPYQNKHYESVFTRFYEGYWMVQKFGFDKRKAYFSSLILSDQLSRKDALQQLSNPPYDELQAMKDLTYICRKLSISREDFLELMNQPNKTYKDYKNNSRWISLAVLVARMLKVETRQYR
jgi:N-acetyl sugar amidotransferase